MMRGDARKRLEAQRQAHPDPAVRELLAKAWDEGATAASEYGGAYLRTFLVDNPYRSES